MFNFLCFSVLIGKNEVIKISDFGTSRQWSEHSTKMSFAGNRNNSKLNKLMDRYSVSVLLIFFLLPKFNLCIFTQTCCMI
jgi:hypothetical protein